MIEHVFESREAWLVGRLGKFGGSSLKDVVNLRDGDTKAGVWRAAAESIIGSAAIAEGELTSGQILERGHELEGKAIERFEQATGKKVKRGLIQWERDDDSRMTVSPDGVIGKTAAVEVKCLLSPKHTEALFKRAIPKNTAGYEEQRLQYFIVNDKLTTLYHVFYHPDFPAPLDFFFFTSTRKELQPEIDKYMAAEREAASKVREIVNALTMYSGEELERMETVKAELLAGAEAAHADDMAQVSAMISSKSN